MLLLPNAKKGEPCGPASLDKQGMPVSFCGGTSPLPHPHWHPSPSFQFSRSWPSVFLLSSGWTQTSMPPSLSWQEAAAGQRKPKYYNRCFTLHDLDFIPATSSEASPSPCFHLQGGEWFLLLGVLKIQPRALHTWLALPVSSTLTACTWFLKGL